MKKLLVGWVAVVACCVVPITTAGAAQTVTATVTPNSGPVGTAVTVTGTGCPDNNGDLTRTDGRVYFSRTGNLEDPTFVGIGPIVSDATGAFSVSASIPTDLQTIGHGGVTPLEPGTYFVVVTCADAADNSVLLPFTVTGQTTTSTTAPAPTTTAAAAPAPAATGGQAQPTQPPAQVSSSTVAPGQPLVRTGTDSGQLTGTAALVILTGSLLVLLARPRRASARFR